MLDLGDLTFPELRGVIRGEVPNLDEGGRAVWGLMHADLRRPGTHVLTQEAGERIRALRLPRPLPAAVGHSLLFRQPTNDRSDLLVLITILDEDQAGLSLAWRILKSFRLR